MITRNEFNTLLENQQYDQLHSHKVNNAIILAAGLSKRFLPISAYCPKGLTLVKGEILIERQIRQLQEAGISDIYVVIGYKKELFYYLKDKFNVTIVENDAYKEKDNIESLNLVKHKLGNTYICSVDNYYVNNPFSPYEYTGYYSTIHIDGPTDEWCIESNKDGIIQSVSIGGRDADVMMGYVYFDKTFSDIFKSLLSNLNDDSDYWHHVWEYLYIHHLNQLKLEVKKHKTNTILEFDSIDDAQRFDKNFTTNNREIEFQNRINVF